MELVRLDTNAPFVRRHPAVTVGNFDGVHRGHQALVVAALAAARDQDGAAVVLTFDPHPAQVVNPARLPASLMTLAQKAEVLGALGVDVLAVLPFTAEIAAQEPAEFARLVLRDTLGARTVVVGAGFRFGRGRTGDLPGLQRSGQELGFRVQGVEPVMHEGAPISSTRIREDLGRGAVASASALLGRRFFVDGRVVRGEGRGRTLGIPTANLDVVNELLPATGVYAGWARRPDVPGEQARPCVVNLGRRPTFGGKAVTVEAHVLDFQGDLYDRTVRLEFQERLREERAFAGAQALVEQIHQDIVQARQMLGHVRENGL